MTQSQGPGVAGIVLAGACMVLWFMVVPSLIGLGKSDAAGNAMSQAFTAMFMFVLWVLLAVLTLVAWMKGGMPGPAAVAALILVPASGVATFMALDLLSRQSVPPYSMPIVIPALVPPLIVAFCLWALFPSLRAFVPAAFAGWTTWGGILIVCLGIVPLNGMRDRANAELVAAQQEYEAAYARVPSDAPLWIWVPFLNTPNTSRQEEILAHIRSSDRRQSEAEIMLDRGDFPLGYLGRIDLDPTPSICDKARALLRQQAAKLVPPKPNEQPYSTVRNQAEDAVAAMRWLVGYDCSCNEESQAWQTVAESYRDPGFETVELRELRDSQALGRTLREAPERFSMLSPKSHLRAWLKFADDRVYREQALAGARALDHRTSDAVSMLTQTSDRWGPLLVLKYLPELDLEPTKQLCDAALSLIHDDFAETRIHIPNDPPRYDQFLDRLPADNPLAALRWLAGHGCDADAEITEAVELVHAFRDSPERAAMIASLEQLRRKP
jgi:hypothetical protein